MSKSKCLCLLAAAILFIASFSTWAKSLTLATWNIEWLTLVPSLEIAKSQRDEQDFAVLNEQMQKLSADVLAFQEVDSIAAIKKVVGSEYSIVLSDRSSHTNNRYQFTDINQYTGFAIRQGIPFTDPQDINLLPTQRHKLRFASYVILYPQGTQPIHLLSVHLKAGCSGQYRANQSSCRLLKLQAKAVNEWILSVEKLNQTYVILGDFNHNLAYSSDWLWQTLTANSSKGALLLTQNTPAKCQVRSNKDATHTHQFLSLIDHIIISQSLNTSPAQQLNYSKSQVLTYKLSDHCPISSTLFHD